MRKAVIIAIGVIVAAVLSIVVVYYISEQLPPDLDLILSDSVVSFHETPKVIKWNRKCVGTFCSNLYMSVEFKLSRKDAVSAQKCNYPNYARGLPNTRMPFIGITTKPKDSADVCWKEYGELYGEGLNFFAIYDDILFFCYEKG